MKTFFAFFVSMYNFLLYERICRRFKRASYLFPELKQGMEIIEIIFGKGTGQVSVSSPFKVRSLVLFFDNEPIYAARVNTIPLGKEGYLYLIKKSGYFVDLFYKGGHMDEEVDFSFDPEGVVDEYGQNKCPTKVKFSWE